MNDPRDTPALSHPGRELFPPLPAGRVFVNAAYMTPEPAAALAALRSSVEGLACPSFGPDEFFEPPERVRELLAQLVGGAAAHFSLTGSASFGMATLGWNLRVSAGELVGARRRILGVDGQFPSNVQTWRRLESAGFELLLVDGGEGASERLLGALDDRTALVAIEPLSWTDGRRLDVEAVLAAARAAGALTLLDVTQSVGADEPLSDELPCDVVVGAGYKWLLGPYGTGFLRLGPELQERLEPLEANWKNFENSSDFNRLNEYRPAFASPAAKFDHGESSAFLRLAGWQAGLATLVELGPRAVREHARAFATALGEQLNPARFEVSDVASPTQAPHLFRVAPRNATDFAPITEALARAGVSVSQRDGGWRISPHVYNDGQHLERLVGALSG